MPLLDRYRADLYERTQALLSAGATPFPLVGIMTRLAVDLILTEAPGPQREVMVEWLADAMGWLTEVLPLPTDEARARIMALALASLAGEAPHGH